MAAISPQFGALEAMGNRLTSGALAKNPGGTTDRFCQRCHNPVDVALDNIPTYADSDGKILSNFASDIGKRALSCDYCHQVSEPDMTRTARSAIWAMASPTSPLRLTPGSGVKYGPISDPTSESRPHLHQQRTTYVAPNSAAAVTMFGCAPTMSWLPARTSSVWKISLQNGKRDRTALKNNKVGGVVSCQDCHMSAYPTEPPGTYIENETATTFPDPGSAVKRTVSTHYFTGVDIALIPFPGQDDAGLDSHGLPIGQKQRRDELLQAAAAITLTAPSTVDPGARAADHGRRQKRRRRAQYPLRLLPRAADVGRTDGERCQWRRDLRVRHA